MRRIAALIALLLFVLAAAALISLPVQAPAQAQAQPVSTPTPLPLFALPNANLNVAFRSSSIAVRPNDTRIIGAVNLLNNSVTFAIPSQSRVLAEVPVGDDPRSIAFTPDGNLALVANRGSASLTVIDTSQYTTVTTIPLPGAWAYGVATDNSRAYVSLFGSGQIAVIDLASQSVSAVIDVPDYPAGLSLWGDFLYVTHYWSGQISLIYLPGLRVIQTVSTGADTGVFQAIELDISRGIAYLPQTRLNSSNRLPTFDTLAFPVISIVNLRDLTMDDGARVALDSADQPINMPFALALDRFAQRLYVANAGSDDISVIDLNTGRARAHIQVGVNPRGLVLNADNSLLYVHNALDSTVTTINTITLAVNDVLPLTSLGVSADELLGAQLFHAARDPRIAADGWLSCATCHFDGTSDGRVWAGFPGGSRNTPLLYRLAETVPYQWAGDWDELADVEWRIRHLLAGQGLIEETPSADSPLGGLSLDLDLLTTYLINLPPPPVTVLPAADPEVIRRGAAVFAEQDCASCHVGTVGTHLQLVDVGTDGVFDTPSLRWLALSAPYFHDGRAATLRQVFELPGAHQLVQVAQPDEIDALVAYLLAWGETPPSGE